MTMNFNSYIYGMIIRMAIVLLHTSLQVAVRMEIFDWVMVRQCMKDVWRCALMECGGLYIMLDGRQRIPQLCVGNLATNLKVHDQCVLALAKKIPISFSNRTRLWISASLSMGLLLLLLLLLLFPILWLLWWRLHTIWTRKWTNMAKPCAMWWKWEQAARLWLPQLHLRQPR